MAPAVPERLGRYRLRERLGEGGMAAVHRADDEQLGRAVAIKIMHPLLAASDEAPARFRREARAVAQLRHPNVLQVHDYSAGEGEQPAYLVCELIEGPTLRRFLEQHGAPLAEVAALVGVKLARALHAAHAVGIVHRDVKPENVMIDLSPSSRGRIVLCDFGIAQLAADATVTRTGAVIGSPAYMSPEQAAGSELGPRSDLFSLGTLLYQLATGVLPFVAREPLVLLSKIHRGEHLPPGAKNPRVPWWIERAIERCLRVDPEARWASGEELAEALEAGLRADGFGAVDDELRAYFGADGDARARWNAAAEERIVAAARAQAEAAAGGGEPTRALAACDRLLAWRPDDPEARALVARLSRRRGRARAIGLLGVLALVGALAIGGAQALRHRRAVPAQPPPGPLTLIAAVPSAPSPIAPPAAPPRRVESGRPRPLPVAGARPRRTAAPPGERAAAPAFVAPPADPPPAAPAAPERGTVILRARPYCQRGLVDGAIAIDVARPLALAAGRHHLRCGGPGGRTLERDFTVAAGETGEVALDFLGAVSVRLALPPGTTVTVDDGAAAGDGATLTLLAGSRHVRLFRAGREVSHGYVDIASACTLRDAPLACGKP